MHILDSDADYMPLNGLLLNIDKIRYLISNIVRPFFKIKYKGIKKY